MKKYILLCLIFFIVHSCNKPCNDCGDPEPTKFIKVKIVNQQGQNILFGSTALYNPDSIKILKEKNNLSITNAIVIKNEDSTILLEFKNYAPKSYIYYNQQTPQDSLEIKLINTTFRCCGTLKSYSKIDSVKFNNRNVTPVNAPLTFVK